MCIHPADRTGIAATVELFDAANEAERTLGRGPTDGSRRMQRSGEGENRGVVDEQSGNVGCKVLNVCQSQNARPDRHNKIRAVGGQSCGDRCHGVGMFLLVLVRAEEFLSKPTILAAVLVGSHGASQHPAGDLVTFAADQEFRVAPTKPSTQNAQHPGNAADSRFNRCRGSSGLSLVTTTSRASTTLSSSPALIRAMASVTLAFHCPIWRPATSELTWPGLAESVSL